MEGYKATVREASRELTARERIKFKDITVTIDNVFELAQFMMYDSSYSLADVTKYWKTYFGDRGNVVGSTLGNYTATLHSIVMPNDKYPTTTYADDVLGFTIPAADDLRTNSDTVGYYYQATYHS